MSYRERLEEFSEYAEKMKPLTVPKDEDTVKIRTFSGNFELTREMLKKVPGSFLADIAEEKINLPRDEKGAIKLKIDKQQFQAIVALLL